MIDFENEKLSHKFASFFFFQGSSYVYLTVKIWMLMNCFSCFSRFKIEFGELTTLNVQIVKIQYWQVDFWDFQMERNEKI